MKADLGEIVEGLSKAGVEFILVGGLAAVVQGAPITTMDVDIVHRQEAKNISKLHSFLRGINAVYRRPDEKIIEPKEEDFFSKGHFLLKTSLGPLDVLAFIEEERKYDDLLPHTMEVDLRGSRIRVLDLNTIAHLKRNSKFPKDRQRLLVIEETLKQLGKSISSEKK
ncbi:MAG: hypothetical protein ACLFRG_15960 [Desulfococcaceae bacterium]